MSGIDEIADQNDPYANDGSRDKKMRGRRRFSVGLPMKQLPKWKSQLRGIRAGQSRGRSEAEKMNLDAIIAQLRHAYEQLAAGNVKDQKQFAEGLIAPQIRALEKISHPQS